MTAVPPRIRLKPAPGRRVRDPETGLPLPPAGAAVAPGPYWTRRLEDGDVTPAGRPAADKKSKEA